jgi:hypothetical protein
MTVVLASELTVRGDPTIAIRAKACPSAEAIEKALPERVHVARDVSLELTVDDVEGGAIVRVTSAEGNSEVRLDGRDCTVLASAVAALADAWFVELPSPRKPEDVAIPPAPASSTGLVARDEPARAGPARWRIAAGLAYVLDDSGETRSTASHIDITWWRWHALGVQAQVRWTGASRLSSVDMTDAVSRRTWAGALLIASRVGHDRLWLEGGAGAAAVISQVEAAMASTVVRSHAAFAAVASAGIRLWKGASLRLDAEALVYPARDRYTVGSITIAHSPWAELGFGGGLEIAFGGRSW